MSLRPLGRSLFWRFSSEGLLREDLSLSASEGDLTCAPVSSIVRLARTILRPRLASGLFLFAIKSHLSRRCMTMPRTGVRILVAIAWNLIVAGIFLFFGASLTTCWFTFLLLSVLYALTEVGRDLGETDRKLESLLEGQQARHPIRALTF